MEYKASRNPRQAQMKLEARCKTEHVFVLKVRDGIASSCSCRRQLPHDLFSVIEQEEYE
ncbi:hypothetical protein KSB_35470 [Ktedonobacter robiniae]|uniref:Uncharacterized protein n=1 Tax=Ktedonobacter robiniae TaxID=2778365 RepID=A0ABQ3UQU7_9CHLR|nr:hypothetical protein KSB_35470 [Ktedonobacter robiniae]